MFMFFNYSNLIDFEGLMLFISIVGNRSISTQRIIVPAFNASIFQMFNSIGTADR